MCGIVGILGASPRSRKEIVAEMMSRVRHRGPDDSRMWVDDDAGVGLGHQRLAIIDLSPAGAQPMSSASGRYVVSYNGEIYNFQELRRELDAAGARFRGESDTEVLCEALEYWGVTEAAKKFRGIFAFAAWNTHDRLLSLVRDHAGVKPCYFAVENNRLLFASEPASILALPEFSARINVAALQELLTFGYISSVRSIFDSMRQVAPGEIRTFSFRNGVLDTGWAEAFWTWPVPASESMDSRRAVEELDLVLREVVRQQLISDRPVGAFLSGGIDSSLLVSIARTLHPGRMKTFSVGFEDSAYNEAHFASAIAAKLETDHTGIIVTEKDALEVIPSLPRVYSEPLGDSSAIPTILVSQVARKEVVVSLSGDGGDELFGGYSRYSLLRALAPAARWTPDIFGRLLESAARALPEPLIRSLAKVVPLSVIGTPERIASAVGKLAGLLRSKSTEEAYRVITLQLDASIIGNYSPVSRRSDYAWQIPGLTTMRRAMLADANAYLPDDLLVKLDRATMAVSLEGRVPLLDVRVIEFASRVPDSLLVSGGKSKYLLRELLSRYLPRPLFERPKVGFNVPVDRWLRGPLREWGEDLMSSLTSVLPPECRPDEILHAWRDHQRWSGRWQPGLWSALMYLAWEREYRLRLGSSAAARAESASF